MRVFRLAIKELIRRPQRNALLMLAIVVSIALITSLTIVGNSANKTILEVIAKTGHTLTVKPAITEENATSLGNLTTTEVVIGKYIPETVIPEIKKLYDKAIQSGWEKRGTLLTSIGSIEKEIRIEPPTWAPRLYEKVRFKDKDIIVAGVEFDKEYFVRFWWNLSSGEWPTDATRLREVHEDEALIGGSLSTALGYKTGDRITINNMELRILGVLEETNSPDDYMLFIPLKTAQKIFNKKGLVSLLSVRAMCPQCPVGDAMVELNKTITGITAVSQLDVAQVQFDFFNMLYKFLLAVIISTIAVGIFSIFNTVTGSLYARVREIGMLKAVGASGFQLLRIFLYEQLILGLTAGIVGYTVGIGLAYILNSLLGIKAIIKLNPEYIWRALIFGVICSLAAIIYPAYKLSKIKITETFRTQWEI